MINIFLYISIKFKYQYIHIYHYFLQQHFFKCVMFGNHGVNCGLVLSFKSKKFQYLIVRAHI